VRLYLTVTEALEIQRLQVDLFGGYHGVRDMGLLESGGHSIVIDGENLAPGTYFATLKTDQGSFTKTIVVNK